MSPTEPITAISCSTGVGATFHGLSRGADALISAGILDKLKSLGYSVASRKPFDPIEGTILTGNNQDVISVNGVKDEDLAVEINRKIKREVLDSLSTSTSASESDPETQPPLHLILGGVCHMVPAVASAFMEALPTRKLGIIWFDADADLGLPEEIPTGASGIIACMAFSQMTMREGALMSMKEFSAPGHSHTHTHTHSHSHSHSHSHADITEGKGANVTGVSNPTNTILFGLNTTHPSIVPRTHLTYLLDNNYRIFSSHALSRSTTSARLCAQQALDHLTSNGCDTILLHIDVDAIDGREFPLGNIPNLTGLSVEGFMAALEVFVSDQRVRGVTLTEMNPDRDEGLVMTGRLVEGVVGAFEGRKRKGGMGRER